jgi:hypothetical protein
MRIAVILLLLLVLGCSQETIAPAAPSAAGPAAPLRNADPWLWMVPAGQSRYHVAAMRADVVFVYESGEERRYPMWFRGDPILLQDATTFPSGGPPIVHYLVTFGDVLPWYLQMGTVKP